MAELKRLEAPAAPNLPLAPTVYSGQHYDILNNVLRLYFNRLAESLKALFGTNGGKYIAFPYIAASDSTNQYATASNTATKVLWDTADSISGFTLNPTGSASSAQSGIYKIDYSLQLANTDNAQHDVWVWLKVNGVDVPKSTSKFTLQARKSAGVYSYTVAYSSVVYTMNTDDYVELWWTTDQAATSGGALGVFMEALPAITSPFAHPVDPSAIGSITFVSALTT